MFRRKKGARLRHAAIRAEMKALSLTRFRIPLVPLIGAVLGILNAIAAVATLSSF